MSEASLPAILPAGSKRADTVGFNRFSGPLYGLPDDGDLTRFAFIAEHKHLNGSGNVHGGMLMTLADVAMSRTTRMKGGSTRPSTVSLSCDFVSGAKLGELIEARVRIVRQTRTLMFMSAGIACGERPVMNASGLWKIA